MAEAAESTDKALSRRAAQQAVAESKQSPTPMESYLLVARQLPLYLRQHGLGQTLVYLQARGRRMEHSPYSLLLRQIDRLVGEAFRTNGEALTVITQNDSDTYVRAVRLTNTFSTELIALAERFA